MPKTYWFGANSVTFPDEMADDEVQARLKPLIGKFTGKATQNDAAVHQMHVDRLAALRAPSGAPVEPTGAERAKSALAAGIAGGDDLVSSVVAGLPESAANLLTAMPRSAYAAGKTLAGGGSVSEAFDAAKGVQPNRTLSESAGRAVAHDFSSARENLGVRPNANTDNSDAFARLTPQVVAALIGAKGMLGGKPIAAEELPRAEPVNAEPVAIRGGGALPNANALSKAEAENAWKILPDEKKAQVFDDIRAKPVADMTPQQLGESSADWLADIPEVQGVKDGVAEPMSAEEMRSLGLGEPEPAAPQVAPRPPFEPPQNQGGAHPPSFTPRGNAEPTAQRSTAMRIYNRAVPQIVDAIESQGPVGQETALKMRQAQQFADSGYSQRAVAIDKLSKGMSDEELTKARQVVEQWDSRGLDDPSRLLKVANNDQRVANLASFLRKNVFEYVDGLAKDHVEDYATMDDYFTHIGKRPEDMPANVQNLVTRAGNESKNLTRARGEGSAGPEGKDVIRAAKGYLGGSLRYIGQLKEFGAKNRGELDAALNGLADAAQKSGFDGDLIRRYGAKAMGGGATDDPALAKPADALIYAEAITKPVFAPIRHFQQIRNDITVFGAKNTLAGTVDTFVQKLGLSPEGAQAVIDSGAMVRNAAEDMAHSSTRGPIVSALKKTSDVVNAPVRWVDNVKAKVTANAAARHYAEVVDLASGRPVPAFKRAMGDLRPTPDIQKQAVADLQRAGVDVNTLRDPKAYREGMLKYMWQKVQDTQKSTTPLGSPALALTPWGRVLYTFNRPLAFGTDFALRNVIAPATKGNLQPLVRYAVGSVIGYGTSEAAVDTLRGKNKDILVRAAKGKDVTAPEVAEYAGEALAPHGLVPRYHVRGLGPVSNYLLTHAGALGATIQDADNVAAAVQQKSVKPLVRSEGHIKTAQELWKVLTGQ